MKPSLIQGIYIKALFYLNSVLNYISNKSIQIITHDSLLFKSLLLII